MSFSTKITFVPRDNEEKSVSFDHVNIGVGTSFDMGKLLSEKFKSLTFREILSDVYYDYVSILTFEEFQTFYESNLNTNILPETEMKRFELTRSGQVRYNWVIIEVYEWDF